MIKPTEIKLNNWVWNPVQKKPCKVDIRILMGIIEDSQAAERPGFAFEEIPLNEKWLLSFGASPAKITGFIVDGARYWKLNDIIFYEKKGVYYLKVGEQIGPGENYLTFNTVHDFQNLFSIDGMELKYKP